MKKKQFVRTREGYMPDWQPTFLARQWYFPMDSFYRSIPPRSIYLLTLYLEEYIPATQVQVLASYFLADCKDTDLLENINLLPETALGARLFSTGLLLQYIQYPPFLGVTPRYFLYYCFKIKILIYLMSSKLLVVIAQDLLAS